MKIAIVKLSALGDIVHASIVLEYIKSHLPDAQIDWIIDERFAGIFKEHPLINEVIPISTKSGFLKLKVSLKELYALRKKEYDLVIDLQGLLKSAIVSRLIGAKKVAGFSRQSTREGAASMFYHYQAVIPYEGNVIRRNLLLVSIALGLPYCEDFIVHKKDTLYVRHSFPKSDKKLVMIVYGSSWKSKIYPKKQLIEVINGLKDCEVVLLWGCEKEWRMVEAIASKTHATVLPKMNLSKLISYTKHCDLVIGSDSGPTHIAWALNVPSVTIFGPTPSYRNTYTTTKNLIIDSGKEIDAKRLNKNDDCIKQIDPQDIIALSRGLLDG